MFIAYTDMCADLCHYGHFNYLDLVHTRLVELASGQPYKLIVGIHNDDTIASYKRVPILSMYERCKMIKYHPNVDVIVDNAPLKVDLEYLGKYNVNVLFTGSRPMEELQMMYNIPMEMIEVIPYTEGISTTDIIGRVLRLCKNDIR
jgi:cytidyltransferase-like protein